MRRLVLMFALLILVAAPGAGLAQSCVVSGDKTTVRLRIDNPHDQATSCTVDCNIETARGGQAMVSCTKTVPAKISNFELCARTRADNALYGGVLEVKGACETPAATKDDEEDDSDDDDDEEEDENKK